MTKELDNVLDELNFVPDSDNYFVNQAIQFRELMMMYNCAIREVRTKLEVLNDELSIRNSRNPIEFIESRIKRPLSIVDKLKRYGEPVNVESIERSLNDVAGIRVICRSRCVSRFRSGPSQWISGQVLTISLNTSMTFPMPMNCRHS